MNRQLRLEAAYEAVAQALLVGEWITEARLLEIATEKLGPRAAFLAPRAVNRCVQAADGTIGPDIAIATATTDENGVDATFMFKFIGR